MAKGTKWQSYKDPISQISSLYVVWFDLLGLSYLIANKEGKTPKKAKNSHKYVKYHFFCKCNGM